MHVARIITDRGGGAQVTARRLREHIDDIQFTDVEPYEPIPDTCDMIVVHETNEHEPKVLWRLRNEDRPVLKVVHAAFYHLCEKTYHGGPCTGARLSCSSDIHELLMNGYRRYLHRQLFQRVYDRFLCTSPHVSEVISNATSVPGKFMPNGVDVDKVSYDATVPSEPSLMMAGTLDGIKRFRDVVTKIDVPITVFGKGKHADVFRETANVTYRGHVDRQEVLNSYQNHTATILNTEIFEISSTVALESMAAGTPVISNRKSVWFLIDGYNGYYFHDISEIPELTRQVSRSQGEQARDLVESTFSFDKTVHVYHSTLWNMFKNMT